MLKRYKKSFVGILFALLSGMAVTALGSGLAGSKPNIIVVLLDDMGFSDLGCYGGDIDTPVIDGLAEEGLRFTRFTNSAKCTTSRYSLLSGQYHGSGYNKMSRSTTLAEPLKKAGYATWAIGKWDTHKTTPLDYGFEKFFGFVGGSSDSVAGNGKWLLNENRFKDFGKDASEFYATKDLTDFLIQLLKEKEETKDKRPFFIYASYNAPHGPLQAEEDLMRKYRGRYMKGWETLREERFKRQKALGMFDESIKLPEWQSNHRKWEDLTDNEKSWEDYRMAIYAAMVESVDRNLGRLKKELENAGQWENTLVLFMSDNGANPYERSGRGHILPWKPKCGMRQGTEWASVSNTPFRMYKQNTLMGGISTPLIAHWPAGLKAKSWDNTLSHIVDIMPTLLELSGGKYPETMRGQKVGEMVGVSLVPLLNGQKVEREKPRFYSYVGSNGLWNERYKLVSSRGGPWMLFNTEKDPVENYDIAASHPEIVKTMSEEWYKIGNRIKVHKDSRAPRKETSRPWGGPKSKRDEQHPVWGNKKPPLPLPNE